MLKHSIICFIFLFYCSLTTVNAIVNSFSTNPSFRRLSVENGLPANGISSIIQDKMGFIWIGTENGLCRFDGIKVKTFVHNENDPTSLSGNSVAKIICDTENNIWICTNEGFDLYNPKGDCFIHISASIIKNKKTTITTQFYTPSALADYDNVLVSIGGEGIYKLNKKNLTLYKLFLYKDRNKTFDVTNITSMIAIKKGSLLFGSQTLGLFYCKDSLSFFKNFKYETNKNLGSNIIYSLYQSNNNRILIGTNNGMSIFNLNDDSFSLIQKQNGSCGLSSNVVWTISSDKNNNIWIGTNGEGVNVSNLTSNCFSHFISNELDPNSLSDNNIRAILHDNQGNIWVGTQKGGVCYALKNNSDVFQSVKRNIYKHNGLTNNSITSIVENSERNIIVGTDGGGLLKFDNVTQTFKSIDPNSESVLTILEDKDGNLWYGGYMTGVKYIEKKSGKCFVFKHEINNEKSLVHDDVRCIFQDSYGTIWIATNGGGVCKFDTKTKTFYKPNIPVLNSLKYSLVIHEDKNKCLWIGSYNGLYLYDIQTNSCKPYMYNKNNPKSLTSNWIYCIVENDEGDIFIGTNSGLNKYRPKTDDFQRYSSVSLIGTEAINGICFESKNKLWISTNMGLVLFDEKTNTTRNYLVYDGLQSNQFNHGAFCKARNGTLFFGGIYGMTFFNPFLIRINTLIPNVYITNVETAPEFNLGNDKLNFEIGQKELIISYKQASVLNIEFAGLNYINSEQNKYAYKLEGFDDKWHYNNLNQVRYTNLSPGKYVFHVKASNNDGIWNNEGAQIKIIITPPFWKSIWAYFIYFISILGLLFFVWRYTVLKLKFKKELEFEHFERQKAEEIAKMKNEFFITTSHELSTPLALILAPVERMVQLKEYNDKLMNMVQNNAKRMLRLINDLLELQRMDVVQISLQVSKNDIVKFIKLIVAEIEQLAYQKNISVEISTEIETCEVFFDRIQLEKVFYNLLSNSIKYNQIGGGIIVRIRKDDQQETVLIDVIDNGIGIDADKLSYIFDKYYRVSTDNKQLAYTKETGYGIGLFLSKQIVDLHHGNISVSSEKGTGTTFTVQLPLYNKFDDNQMILTVVDEVEITENNEVVEYSSEENHGKSIILLVEDNVELVELIENILDNNYSIIKAYNGIDGLKLAERYIPDIIITDIMMPVMDGIELCKKLKKNFNTSHIPVIILTALNSNQYMMNGLETGADDYITKPFHPEILNLKIHNILYNRKLLQQRFVTNAISDIHEMSIPNSDEILLSKLIEFIDKNIDNEQLNVDMVTSYMNMSQASLYRKVKSITGLSINHFIRTIRLKRAAYLIENDKRTIQEIAQMVGFVDIKYFRKCFQQQFGCNPSEYELFKSK